ncbi:hypothetical protein ACFE04_003804 [Oxalis oulophora]
MGCFDDALNLFDEMCQSGLKPDCITFGTLVYGVKPDAYVYASLIKGLCKADDEAFSVLEEMKSNGCYPNTMTYNVIINGFVREKDFESAYTILHEMERHARSYDASEESYGGWKQSSFEN